MLDNKILTVDEVKKNVDHVNRFKPDTPGAVPWEVIYYPSKNILDLCESHEKLRVMVKELARLLEEMTEQYGHAMGGAANDPEIRNFVAKAKQAWELSLKQCC